MYICKKINIVRKNRVFLEKIGGEWLDDFVYVSVEPLKSLGFKIIPFDGDDLEDTLLCYVLDISKDVIIGSVGATSKFFLGCGIEVPKYLGYSKYLKTYLGRDIIETTFGKTKEFKTPYFIKPSKGVKKFTGCLIEKNSDLDFMRDYNGIVDSDPIFLSDPIEFISEFRCFVHEGELKGIQYYLGDFKKFPDVGVIEDMISSYDSDNCAYTLDVGVISTGETLLVEVNDMWAIGSYGFNSNEYALMCVRRMREIGRQFNCEVEPLWKKLKKRWE